MFRVLIVEDNTHFRQALKMCLSARFPLMAFEEAKDGNEVLQKVNDFLPDLIFMDIKLAGESGLELTKEIKGSCPEIIIIILTSYDLPEYRKAAIQGGADYFLSKGSSDTREILQLVESISAKLQSEKTKNG